MNLYAHEEDGKVLIETVVLKDWEKPDDWIPVTKDELPPKKYREFWQIAAGEVIVSAEDMSAVDGELTELEMRQRFAETYHTDKLMHIMLDGFEAIARGEDLPANVMKVLQIRNTIRNQN